MIGGLLKSASSTALFAALGIIALSTGVPAAKAADLGGDCCADLEERVAELEATTARKGNRRVSLSISGQVSTAVMAWDDGENSDVYIVDGTYNGGTQFQLSGNAQINPNLSAGFQIVVGLDKGARSQQVSADDDDGGNGSDTTIVMTLANWYLNHKQLGRLTVGRINTSTAGVTTVNLGGTGVVANASIGYWNRGFDAVDAGGGSSFSWNELLGGFSVNGASLSRANAISYTSPTFGGFSVSASWGEDDLWDTALRYAGEFSGFRVAGAIGYRDNCCGTGEVSDGPGFPDDVNTSQVVGSASILHVGSGLFLAGSYLNQDNDEEDLDDTTLYYVQGGITKNWTGLGKTAFYGEYANVDGGLHARAGGGAALETDSAVDMWGLGVVQHIDAAAMELYLSYRNYSADAKGEDDIEDMSVVLGGARIRF